MPKSPLGHTLVIANPTAHSGRGKEAAYYTRHFLESYASVTNGFELRLTSAAGDAEHIATEAGKQGFDTVVALGGDGVIHEVVNGLMALPAQTRPQLGIIPVGSGNDYARTLGMVRNDAEAALAQLVRGHTIPVEVGLVNGVYFMQTLSFGLDAAIALDTTDRRAAGTDQEGEALFVTSGIKIMAGARHGRPCTVSFDGEAEQCLRELIFAVQVGPTYGGGFPVCPEADPSDGLLDVCFNVKKPLTPHLLALFGLARWGKHVGSKVVRLRRARSIDLTFKKEPPAQVDGERITGTHFCIQVIPEALQVVVP